MGLTIKDSYKNLERLSFRLGGEQDYKYWEMRKIETHLVELAKQSGLAWAIPDGGGNELFQKQFSTEDYDRWLSRLEMPTRYRPIQGVLCILDNETEISSEESFYPRFLCLKLFSTDMADWEDVLGEEYDNYHDQIAFVKKLEIWVAGLAIFDWRVFQGRFGAQTSI